MERKTVRELREERGVSREALAAAVGVAFSTVVRLEKQEYQPRLNVAIKIAAYFGVPVEAIDWGEQVAAAA